MDLKEIKEDLVLRHPWETSRVHFFLKFLKSNKRKEIKDILDVGAGDGFFAKGMRNSLAPFAQLYCFDIHYKEKNKEKKREENIFFVKNLPSQKFDLILLMDVLEHVSSEKIFLDELIEKNSHSETLFLISVPSWQSLYTQHDRKLEHFRRYSFKMLEDSLKRSDLEIIHAGGLFYFLLIPRLFTKCFEIIFPEKNGTSDLGEWKWGYLVTNIVLYFLKIDHLFSILFFKIGLRLPGLSLWALVRRRRV